MKRLLFDCGTREGSPSFALFFLRAATGLMMLFGHGMAKIENFASYKEFWHVPFLSGDIPAGARTASLILTIAAEVGASALLVLGLLTRPAAFILGFAMVIAAFDYHGADPWFLQPDGPSKEPALLYLISAVTILLAGAGGWSLDALVYRDSKRWRR